jgi:hypothetical protein
MERFKKNGIFMNNKKNAIHGMLMNNKRCRNLSLGFTTKTWACKGAGQE